jgi:lysyl-tRNA synthetase class 2
MSTSKQQDKQVEELSEQGATEQSLIAARRAKAERVRARGENPFSNEVDSSKVTDVGTLRAYFAPAKEGTAEQPVYVAEKVQALGTGAPWGEKVQIAGRIVASRSFGKANFLRLRDWAGEIQLFCRKNVLGDNFGRLDDLDVGDHILAIGQVMVTKTGELTVDASDLRLLTKAYRPLPAKWHGLSDVEVRYRQRYLDLVANEEARDIFRARSLIVRALRGYLDGLGFLEVETPTMNALVGGAAARPFITHHNALDMQLFMRIAPELYLKRLVVGGFERVYEIGRCYRNEGLSTRHNPEFTMLEFYRAYATYDTLMDMTEEMLRYVDKTLAEQLPVQHARWKETRPFTFEQPFVRKTMHELLRYRLTPEAKALIEEKKGIELGKFENIGLDAEAIGNPEKLEAVFRDAVDPSKGKLEAATRKQVAGCENYGERVFLLYELMVEPNLPVLFRSGDKSLPVFVTDHPVETSPLARRQTRVGGDPRLVDRFELFVEARELCNAFSELNDPDDQAARFSEQVAKKARGADETMDYDEDYIRALEQGLPPTAGFGMGIDRLVMMLTSQPSIREVILFPLLRPEH